MKREINVTLRDSIGKELSFETLNQFRDFCNKEMKFWHDENEKLPDNVVANQQFTKLNHLQSIMNTLNSWQESEPTWDEAAFNQQFRQLTQQQINQLSGDWVWHGHACVPIWLELYERNQATADSFMSTMLNKPPSTIANSVEHMSGHILAYEFLLQDENDLTKRRSSEKKSLTQLRNELTEKNNELIANVETFQDDFSNWNDSTKISVERLYRVRQKLSERQARNQERIFARELAGWKEKVTNLENTYAELLRLKKPAEYWNNSAKKYWHQGLVFSGLILVSVIVGLKYFEGFFIAWLQGQELNVSLNTLQGVVIFGSIVAIYD